ncbi:MAG TPA: YbaK/EbsC family protein [Candidatus Angelobacter sp.]|nr:YbaK/EbsC family protein [Candidatus Angelobacter sp.]
MSAEKLKQFLDHEHAKYVTITHPEACTAQEVAESAHVPGKELAKSVVVQMGGRMAMAVLPADRKLDLSELREIAGNANARLATEDEFKGLFPDCEVGAMPPFGNLYGMDVYVASPLAEDDEIAFNAGSHTELIRMPFDDFQRLAHAKVADFAT